jgi:maltokinase
LTLQELLADWLPDQRWFAGKGRAIDDVTVESDIELRSGEPVLRHLIIAVRQGAAAERYQVLLGVRSGLPDRLKHAEIGWIAGGQGCAYDGAHDPEVTGAILDGMAGDAEIGDLAFHHVPGAVITSGLHSMVIGAEQSNTSLVYGEAYVCKLFRRLAPGANPDLELNVALAREGSGHIATPYGWLQGTVAGEPTTLAVLSRYLRTATDGWTLAATSVRDLYADEQVRAADAGGDFAGEAGRLGRATAEIHRDLANALGTSELPFDEVRALTDGMRERLKTAVAEVPELALSAPMIEAAYDALAHADAPLTVQRVHGDFHLGQVVRTDQRWVVLDFEGEPARPLAERRTPTTPLRDIAGMLRSFEYAARYQLVGSPDEAGLEPRARDWAKRNRDAFCAGYAYGGGLNPYDHAVVLRALEFDKAVYEVMYEARNRPTWLRIPLNSLARVE